RKDSANHQAITELGGKDVGLVGLGHIAQLLAGFLSGLRTELPFSDKYVAGPERRVQVDSLEVLVPRPEDISLQCLLYTT
ncbi:NAD(P)-dependent oxidoreductase, partial [Klebsiella pneumoniae]|uniref:NAD(P)-dependent oxidoreductase n=1 Tax=Klebsiella pneumoniae TaxID=573 RepID=UPI002731F8C5